MKRRQHASTPLFACMEPEVKPERPREVPELAPGAGQMQTLTNPYDWQPVECTACRYVGQLQHFDCMGLDEDDLQCPECGFVDGMERYT